MLFSKTMIHGIYILCYLSRQDEDTVVPAAPVAEAMNVPPEQAAKVLQALARAGVVRSVRGRRGGYALAKPLGEITLDDLFEALCPPHEDECFGPRSCPVDDDRTCSAYHGLVALYQRIRTFLGKETLAPLIEGSCEVGDEAFREAGKTSDGGKPPAPGCHCGRPASGGACESAEAEEGTEPGPTLKRTL